MGKRYEFFIGVKDSENDTISHYTLSRAQIKAIFILLGLEIRNNSDSSVEIADERHIFQEYMQMFGVNHDGYHGLVETDDFGKYVKEGSDLIFNEELGGYFAEEDEYEDDRWGFIRKLIDGFKAYNAEHYKKWSEGKLNPRTSIGELNLGAEIWVRYCNDVIRKIDKLP